MPIKTDNNSSAPPDDGVRHLDRGRSANTFRLVGRAVVAAFVDGSARLGAPEPALNESLFAAPQLANPLRLDEILDDLAIRVLVSERLRVPMVQSQCKYSRHLARFLWWTTRNVNVINRDEAQTNLFRWLSAVLDS